MLAKVLLGAIAGSYNNGLDEGCLLGILPFSTVLLPMLSPSAETIETTTRQLKRACFDGDRPAFDAAFQAYVKQWGQEDPHARHLCNHVIRDTYGLLSFQTFGALPPHAYQAGRRHRWSMWLSIFPLDHQLRLIRQELRGEEDIQLLDWKAIKWHQYHAISSNQEFRHSALGGWVNERTPGPGSPQYSGQPSAHLNTDSSTPKTWEQVSTGIIQTAYDVAMEMVGCKSWQALQAWFEDAKLDPCAHQHEFYLHYTTATGGGSTLTKALHPLPFWVTCLFSGAQEPGFWEAMAHCGGPSGPKAGPAWDDPVRQTLLGGFEAVLPPPDFSRPSDWIQARVSLEAEVYHSINQTAAAWREQILEKTLNTKASATKPSRL